MKVKNKKAPWSIKKILVVGGLVLLLLSAFIAVKLYDTYVVSADKEVASMKRNIENLPMVDGCRLADIEIVRKSIATPTMGSFNYDCEPVPLPKIYTLLTTHFKERGLERTIAYGEKEPLVPTESTMASDVLLEFRTPSPELMFSYSFDLEDASGSDQTTPTLKFKDAYTRKIRVTADIFS